MTYGVQKPPEFNAVNSWPYLRWLNTLQQYIQSRVGYVTVTTSYDVPAGVFLVLCDCSGGNITVTLPSTITNEGRQICVKKIDSSGNTVTIDSFSGENIEGASTSTLTTQWATKLFMSNGQAWYRITTATA